MNKSLKTILTSFSLLLLNAQLVLAHGGAESLGSDSITETSSSGMGFGMGYSPDMMEYHNNMMSRYGVFAGLTWLILIAFLLSGIYFFLKKANHKHK